MASSEQAGPGPAHDRPAARGFHSSAPAWPRVHLGGVTVDLLRVADVVEVVSEFAEKRTSGPLGVTAVNVEHLGHFGSGRVGARRERDALEASSVAHDVSWLGLLDDPRLHSVATRLAGRSWPLVGMFELTAAVLDLAERRGLRMGFLWPRQRRAEALQTVLAARWPKLLVKGVWVCAAATFDDDQTAGELAATIKRAKVDVLVIGVGKPRQERWIAEHGASSGAAVHLAVGSAARASRLLSGPGPHGADPDLRAEWVHDDLTGFPAGRLLRAASAYRALRRDSFGPDPHRSS